MSTKKITDLDNYPSPDRAVDVFPIVDVGNDQTKKATINAALGITGNPVGTTDTQTLSNKTLDDSTILAITDGNLTLENTADPTKQLQFDLTNLTTADVSVWAAPENIGSNETLVFEALTQTLDSKTLTNATLNSPTITNANITADQITGFTSANSGSIYGIPVTDSTIGPSTLSTGTIKLGYAQITTNFTLSSSQTTPTQITGLSVTVTIPTGGRSIQITVYCGALQPAAGVAVMGLWDGTVGVGTQIGQANSSADNAAVTLQAVVTPSSGSKTYNASIANTGTNNVTVGASSVVQPAFILVEAI